MNQAETKIGNAKILVHLSCCPLSGHDATDWLLLAPAGRYACPSTETRAEPVLQHSSILTSERSGIVSAWHRYRATPVWLLDPRPHAAWHSQQERQAATPCRLHRCTFGLSHSCHLLLPPCHHMKRSASDCTTEQHEEQDVNALEEHIRHELADQRLGTPVCAGRALILQPGNSVCQAYRRLTKLTAQAMMTVHRNRKGRHGSLMPDWCNKAHGRDAPAPCRLASSEPAPPDGWIDSQTTLLFTPNTIRQCVLHRSERVSNLIPNNAR